MIKKIILAVFALITVLSCYFVFQLKFSFDFEQFFPSGDEDLAFFKSFKEEFEPDDNFIIVALENHPSIFDTAFLSQVHRFTLDARSLPSVKSSESLTTLKAPIKTPFGYSTLPILHYKNPNLFQQDSLLIIKDERLVGNFINQKSNALCIYLKTKDGLNIEESSVLIDSLLTLLGQFDFEANHLLGRAYFQDALVDIQKQEILRSSIFSFFLVSILLIWIYRKPTIVFIVLISISLSLIYFLGFMGVLGRELSIMSALYPVLMLIVGTSDVIHIMTKYLDELKKGTPKALAMKTTVKEIGMATFLTSVTTAIGFLSLLTSRVKPVRDFGLNSAIGVMIAFITVIFLTTTLLTLFDKEKLLSKTKDHTRWTDLVDRIYLTTLRLPRRILLSFLAVIVLSVLGISRLSTDYRIERNLPRTGKITDDFKYFERELGGFRPMEFVVSVKDGYKADDYEVLSQVNLVEEMLRKQEGVNSIMSMASIVKSIQRSIYHNDPLKYQFPDTKEEFEKTKPLLNRYLRTEQSSFINEDKSKARIITRLQDIGAESAKTLGTQLDHWVDENLDADIVEVKRTGTGLIIDKNSVYVTESLFYGLGSSIIIISLLMAFLLKSWKMFVLAFLPNFIPLLFAGAILGYLGQELEASISITFAVIFGIAVDDTIHFLSKYMLAKRSGLDVEPALKKTFDDTGKALIITTLLLFVGFITTLFSQNPPTQIVGSLIAVTLVSALLCDILLLPVLMRKWLPPKR